MNKFIPQYEHHNQIALIVMFFCTRNGEGFLNENIE
ncbi:hypothetical protein ICS_05714 [Bacillus cereus BAG2O-3]|nr:hypothetical protein ICS_05714 [Bacillus cereus BAG2O-3]